MAQAVHVEDGHEVVQVVVGSESHCLPDGAFGGLAISHEAVHAVAEAGQERLRLGLGIFWVTQQIDFTERNKGTG